MNIGYHYTSLKNWESIKNTGLIPHNIDKEELKPFFKNYPPSGVWLWIRDFNTVHHLFSIIFQAATKQDPKVVKLKVFYPEKNILKSEIPKKQKIILTHDAYFENFSLHDHQKAIIVNKKIDPKYIEVLGIYDINKLLNK